MKMLVRRDCGRRNGSQRCEALASVEHCGSITQPASHAVPDPMKLSCEGSLSQAIEEGGHATFLEAKELIAPKKNVSSKKTNLRDEASDLHKEIKHLEERLYLPGISDEEREKMNLLVSEKSDRLKDLEEELSALRQYNHTRFVHARDESRKNIEQERMLEELEQRREEIGNRMLEALEKADEPEISKIQEELNALHEQKDKLLENGQDPFLRESAE